MAIAHHYWKLDGHSPVACTVLELALWQSQTGNAACRVAYDQVGEVEISTVFTGLNHRSDPNLPPLLFETLLTSGQYDGQRQRYTTWDEAETGHKLIVQQLEQGRSVQP
jgi:hypothetical protein